MALVTLITFSTLQEAHIVKAQLEFEDVQVTIFDDYTSALNPLIGVMNGGIHLKIDDKDVEKATEILQNSSNSIYLRKIEKAHCPKCDSTNITEEMNYAKGFKSFMLAIGNIILSAFPMLGEKKYRCLTCKQKFKLTKTNKIALK